MATNRVSEVQDPAKERTVSEHAAPEPAIAEPVVAAAFEPSAPGIFRDEEGKYRWVAEKPMLKNLFLLVEVWKVLGIACLIVLAISLVISLLGGNGLDGALGTLGVLALTCGILLVLSLPAYYIVTKANDGKCTVLFEMDESGIDHIQIKTSKARALDVLVMFVGAAAGNRTTTAAGMLSASGGSLYSRFAGVRKVRALPEKGLIKLTGRLMQNQVYVDAENFDFVLDYIVRHCPQAVAR